MYIPYDQKSDHIGQVEQSWELAVEKKKNPN